MTKLDELERLSKAATPGPWPVHQCRLVKFGATEINEDAKLIAAMRNNIDALIKVTRAASELVNRPYCGQTNCDLKYDDEFETLNKRINELEKLCL